MGIGFVILVIVNIVLGSLSASYYVGVLNPNVVDMNINGTDMNLLTAVYLIVLAGYYHYARQVLEKLAALFFFFA